MKRIFLILAVALVSLTACQKGELIDNPRIDEEPLTGNFQIEATVEQQQGSEDSKTVMSGKIIKWLKGDAICVFDQNGKSATLTTQSTKTSGLFSGTAPSGYGKAAYAIYPSSVATGCSGSQINFTVPATQTYKQGSFASGINVSVGKIEAANTVQFKNVFGMLKLQLKGRHQKVSKLVLTTKGVEALNGTFTVDASSTTPTATATGTVTDSRKSITLVCNPAIELQADVDLQSDFYFVVPVNALSAGFTIDLYDENGKKLSSQLNTNSSKNKIVRSKIIAMPIKCLAIDLSQEESSNCYMIPTSGFYCFKATVKGNGVAVDGASTKISTSGFRRAAIIWEDTAGGVLMQGNNVYYENGYIYFSTNYSGGTGPYHIGGKDNYLIGSAIVALLNDNNYITGNNVLWSWHIWCCGNSVKDVTYANGAEFMDRNLGAKNNSSVNESASLGAYSLGFLYQWGRKDPMTAYFNFETDNSLPRTSTFSGDGYNAKIKTDGSCYPIPYTSLVVKGRRSNPKGTEDQLPAIDWTVGHPRLFAYGKNENMHWAAGSSLYLWGTNKTMYDPCPVGYKVPDSVNFTGMTGTKVTNGFKIGGNFWPRTGMRGFDVDDNNLSHKSDASYWSNKAKKVATATAPGIYVGECLNFSTSNGTFSTSGISYCQTANPVRCVKVK